MPASSLDFLLRPSQLKGEIDNLKIKRQVLRDYAAKTVPQFHETPNGSPEEHKKEKVLVRIADFTAQIEEKEKEMKLLTDDMEELFSRLPNGKHTSVLSARYVDCLSWAEMSEKLNMTGRNCRYLHGEALDEIKKLL